jgi:hypothetical protein
MQLLRNFSTEKLLLFLDRRKTNNYAWLVPFVENETEILLKTIIPRRKATRRYLRGGEQND